MKRSKFTDQQIAYALRRQKKGRRSAMPQDRLQRSTFYAWRSRIEHLGRGAPNSDQNSVLADKEVGDAIVAARPTNLEAVSAGTTGEGVAALATNKAVFAASAVDRILTRLSPESVVADRTYDTISSSPGT